MIDGRHDRGQLMGQVVEQSGIDLTVVGYADSSVTAVEAVGRLRPNAVVLEIQLPVTQGLETVSELRDAFPDLAIIVCSFHAGAATKQAALARGATAYLVKPFSLRDLRSALRPTRIADLGRSRRRSQLVGDGGGVHRAIRVTAAFRGSSRVDR